MTSVELGKPGKQDLAIKAGAGIEVTIPCTIKSTGLPVNWTGYTLTSQVRKDTSAKSQVLATIVVSTGTPTLGILTLTSSDVQSLAEGKYFYDIKASVAGHPDRFVLEGILEVKGSVTRS